MNTAAKGAAGEREFCKALHDELGMNFRRSIAGHGRGQGDIDGLEGFCVEVKRAKKPDIAKWWRQAFEQGIETGKCPLLAYRLDGKKWVVKLPVGYFEPIHSESPDFTVDMSIAAFAALFREREAA